MTPTKGTRVKLGGAVRTLRFTNRALVAIEDELGLTLIEAGAAVQRGSLKAISALAWAGRLHGEPALTLDEVLDQIDLRRLEEIGDAIGQALETALGKATAEGAGTEDPEGNPKAAG